MISSDGMKRSFRISLIVTPLVFLAACSISAGRGEYSNRDIRPGAGASENQRIADLLAADEWGQVLHCRITGGEARFRSGFSRFTVHDFSIVVDERQIVDLFAEGTGERRALWLTFRADRSHLVACPNRFRDHGPSCDLFETRIDRHDPAIAEPLDIPNEIRDADLTCRWPVWRSSDKNFKSSTPATRGTVKYHQ